MDSLNKHASQQTAIGDKKGWTDLGPPLRDQARISRVRLLLAAVVLFGGIAIVLGVILASGSSDTKTPQSSSGDAASGFSSKEEQASEYCEHAMISELTIRRNMEQASLQSFERIESINTAYGPAILVTAKVRGVKGYFPMMYKMVCAYTNVGGTAQTQIGEIDPIPE